MEWFSEWFDSPYYHILYKNRNAEEAKFFIDNLLDYLHLPAQSELIDIPCGKGRHCIYLHQKGYKVTGADLSPESIQEAQRSAALGLDFFVHDMRQSFAENRYDVLLNIFTSFGYFEKEAENQACMDAFAKGIKKGGYIVMDFMNIHKAIANLVVEEKKIIDDITFHITKEVVDKRIIKTIRFEHQNKSYYFQEKVSMLYKEDFMKYFTFAKLTLIDVFGDYALNSFDALQSDRLILIAQK